LLKNSSGACADQRRRQNCLHLNPELDPDL
jgi:hypothetical protein